MKGEMKMKKIEQFMWNSKKYLKNHSPTILSGIASVGVIASTVMAVKATPKALQLLEDATNEKDDKLSKIEVIRIASPAYIPTAITCLSTIICIFGANALNRKQQASLMSAYALLNDSFKKYRDAANSVYGDDADSKIRAEVAKTTYISCDGYSIYNPDMDFENEKLLFYDFYSQRYFNATRTVVLNAQYHLNRNLSLRGEISLNEFYEFLGLTSIDGGDDIGWNMDYMMTWYGALWLDFENEYTKIEDGMECFIISTPIEPLPFTAIEEEYVD